MVRTNLAGHVLLVAALGACGGLSLPLEGEGDPSRAGSPSASSGAGMGGGSSTPAGPSGATWPSLPLETIQIHGAGKYIQDYLVQATFIGDLDGDGYDELALVDDGNSGRVYVFYGRPIFPHELWAADADFILHGISTELVKLGDLDGDGFDDVLFGLNCGRYLGCYDDGFYLVYGSSERLSGEHLVSGNPVGVQPPRWTGGRGSGFETTYMSAANAGDVNGDGRPDILLDVGYYDIGSGAVERVTNLVLGRSDRAQQFPSPRYADATFLRPDDWVSYSPDHGSRTAGDVDGDGFADVLIVAGIRSETPRFTAVSLFYGGRGRFQGTLTPDDADATFLVEEVRPLANLGDLDGDGYADLGLIRHALSDFTRDGVGDPLTRLGVAYGHAERFSGEYADLDFVDFSATSGAGIIGAGAGDIDGDGMQDLIIASPQAPNYDGSVALFLGTGRRWKSDITASEDFLIQGPPGVGTLEGGPAMSTFGAFTSLDGDLNGDGIVDLVVTAPNFPVGSSASAFVFLGAPL